jgi:hypothetical protein
MKIERLERLQRDISEQRLPQLEDCSALIGEVWRLRTALSGKDLEVGYWRDSHHKLEADLHGMAEANQLLTAEIDQLKAVHGLPKCDLETRWSNCAVRLRKQHDMDFSQPYEISNDGTEVYKNNSRLRRFAGMLFGSYARHRAI